MTYSNQKKWRKRVKLDEEKSNSGVTIVQGNQNIWKDGKVNLQNHFMQIKGGKTNMFIKFDVKFDVFFKFEEKRRIVSMWLVQQWIREEFPPNTLNFHFSQFCSCLQTNNGAFRDTFVRQFSLMRTIIFFSCETFLFLRKGSELVTFADQVSLPARSTQKYQKLGTFCNYPKGYYFQE